VKVYIDSDVIIDYLYDREPLSKNSKIIFALVENRKITGYVSSLILQRINYPLSKYLREKEARKKIKSFKKLIFSNLTVRSRPVNVKKMLVRKK
jgi:predicted nucleic acid-binding protein